jgi:hypothetical protein
MKSTKTERPERLRQAFTGSLPDCRLLVYDYENRCAVETTLPQQIETFDFVQSSRVYDERGFLRVTGKAARTGIYTYLAKELDLTDRDPMALVKVYRPPEEVFDSKSLATYLHSDVTNSHPPKLVDAETYKAVSVGHCLSATKDGDFVAVEILVKDAKAIKDIESGKAQLSPGYKTIYVAEDGVCPDTGERYEFKQTGIEVNHIAIVERGRGGAQVRIDDNNGVTPMTIKVMLDSGKYLEVADEAAAKLVTDAIEVLTKRVADAEAKAEKAEAEKDAMEEELEKEKTKSSDAAISERIAAISTVKVDAAKVAGDTFTCDSVDPVEIKRAALAVKRPTVDWSQKSEAYVSAAFDMAIADPAPANQSQLAQLAKDGAAIVQQDGQEPKLSAYDQHKKAQSVAWKGGAK